MLYKGVQFHDIEAPNLMVSSATQCELIVEYNFLKLEKIIIDDDDYFLIRKYTSKMIQNIHILKRKILLIILIKKFLFETEPLKFVLGYPIEVFDVFDKGIMNFQK